VVGSIILLLAATLLLPLPFSHIIPPLVIMLISFAYLEDEGMLLCISCRCPRLLRDHCCDGLGDGLLEKLLWGM
jgi:Exopolysaccharide synthesis, ExoD